MFKKKAAFAILLATLIVLVVPPAVRSEETPQAIFTCADMPITVVECHRGTDISCVGELMIPNKCFMTCITGFQVQQPTDCRAQAIDPIKD